MKVLCTFSGKFGDILWSLATVKQLSKNYGVKVDIGIMPTYESLLPLLKVQPYIDNAFTIEDWICEGSPCGDQPWQPPVKIENGYAKIHHLTYRNHPSGHESLIDFIAMQQGIQLENPIPFIYSGYSTAVSSDLEIVYCPNLVILSFNELYSDLKDRFKSVLNALTTDIMFYDCQSLSWRDAAFIIANAKAYIGCRSSNYVLAHGVGQKNIFIYEPHPHRHGQSIFTKTFSNPYKEDVLAPFTFTPEQSAQLAVDKLKEWLQ